MSRLNDPQMTLGEMFNIMADGDVGASKVMTALSETAGVIDPQSLMGAFGPILSLDRHGLYGSNIEKMYKICEEDPVKMHACLRALQLGILDRDALQGALKGEVVLALDVIVSKVRADLRQFATGYSGPAQP